MKQAQNAVSHAALSNSIRSPKSQMKFGILAAIPTALVATFAASCSEVPVAHESVDTTESEIRYGTIATPFVPGTTPIESMTVLKMGPSCGNPGPSCDCNGTLVDPEWVLSARHCGYATGDTATSHRANGVVVRVIDDVRPHPTEADAVLLHLSQPYTDLPVALLYPDTTASLLNEVTSCYGFAQGQELKYGNDLKVVSYDDWRYIYRENSLGQIDEGGDSGGPCFRNGMQSGIYGTFNGGSPAQATCVSVPTIRDWASATIASLPSTMDKTISLVSPDFALPSTPVGWRVYGSGDFDGDGTADLVWRRTDDTAEAHLWLMNPDGTIKPNGDVAITPADAGWRIYGVGDFNGDRKSDLVWRRTNDTSEARIWLLDGSPNVIDQPLPSADAGLSIQGVGDFNGDGLADLLWRNADDSGAPQIWLLKNGAVIDRQTLPAGSPGWRINGIGDFNGDGRADLVMRRTNDTGEPRLWMQKDGALISDVPLPSADAGLRVYGVADFNADGRSDLLLRRTDDTGAPAIWLLNNGSRVAVQNLATPPDGWRIYATRDFDGNSRADVVWRRANDTAEARIWRVNSTP